MIDDPSNLNLSADEVNGAIQYVPFPKEMVEVADMLVDMAKGRPNYVDGEKDWEVIDNVVKLWVTMRPNEARAFKKQIGKFRDRLDDKKFATDESGEMRVLISIPPYLERLIKAIYPKERIQDRNFAMKFAKRYRGFQIPEQL